MAFATRSLQEKASVKEFKRSAELYEALEASSSWKLTTIDETTTNKQSPEDEFYRLGVLKSYGILETPAEPEYDCITLEAADKFDVEAVVISFCDLGRIWHKSIHHKGRSIHGSQSTTNAGGLKDRSTSFEGHVVQLKRKHDVLVVNDVQKDLRFSKNPLIAETGVVRFFAGAPIRVPEGVILGSISLLDSKPRPQGLNDSERNQLIRLASEIALNLVLR